MDWKSEPTTATLFKSSSAGSTTSVSSTTSQKGGKADPFARQPFNFGRGGSFLPSVDSPSSKEAANAHSQSLMAALTKWRIANGLDAPQANRRASVSPHPTSPSSGQNKAAKIESAFKVIMAKPPAGRTPDDVQLLVEITRTLHAFEELERDKHIEICRLMRLEKLPASAVVFSQGDEPRCWYVVKRGSVSVLVAGLGGTDQSPQRVSVLHKGDGFGDLALRSGTTRNATIRTIEPTELLVLDGTDYRRTIQINHTHKVEEICEFLSRNYIFKAISPTSIVYLAEIIHFRRFPAETVIIREGDNIDHAAEPEGIYFIRSGEVRVLKHILFPETGKKKQMKVATLREGQFFGEIAVMNSGVREATVIASSDVELYALSKLEFLNRITVQTLKRVREHMTEKYPTDAQVVAEHREEAERKRWEQYKQNLVSNIVQDIKVEHTRLRNFGNMMFRSDAPPDGKPTWKH